MSLLVKSDRSFALDTPYFEINDYGLFFPGYSINQRLWCLLFVFKQVTVGEIRGDKLNLDIIFARALQLYYTHHLSLIEYPNKSYRIPPKPRYDLIVSSVIWLQKKGLIKLI